MFSKQHTTMMLGALWLLFLLLYFLCFHHPCIMLITSEWMSVYAYVCFIHEIIFTASEILFFCVLLVYFMFHMRAKNSWKWNILLVSLAVDSMIIFLCALSLAKLQFSYFFLILSCIFPFVLFMNTGTLELIKSIN